MRGPRRAESDVSEKATGLWEHGKRRPNLHTVERKTVKAHALAHIARSARRADTRRPGHRPSLDPHLAAAHLARGSHPTPRLPHDPGSDEPTVVASAAHPELARVLAGEIAAAAMQGRSVSAAPAAAVPVAPPTTAAPAAAAPAAPLAPTARTAELAAALAPLVITEVKLPPPPPPPRPAPDRAAAVAVAVAVHRPRRLARARRTRARLHPVPLAMIVFLLLCGWAAVYRQAWSALSMGDRCRAAWQSLR